MKVLSWNVERRVQTTLGRQLEAALRRAPDIIALQELKTGTYGDWSRGLLGAGYSVISTVDLVGLPYPEPPYPAPPFPPPRRGSIHDHIQRESFNLVAARHPIAALPGLSFEDPEEARFAFPEKYVAARVNVDGVEIDVHNAHLPHGAGRGVVKVHAFEAIRRRIDKDTGKPRVLCGDFNAPESEDESGPVIEQGGRWADDIQSRWIEAERRLLANTKMRDVYRDVHPAGEPFPVSHFTGRREPFTRHRYDYIFASEELVTEHCEYLSDWLERAQTAWRLSDHAPVEAELSMRSSSRT